MAKYDGMTVNERLSAARLFEAYDDARRTGDLNEINMVLTKVGLRQDEKGMNWSVDAEDR